MDFETAPLPSISPQLLLHVQLLVKHFLLQGGGLEVDADTIKRVLSAFLNFFSYKAAKSVAALEEGLFPSLKPEDGQQRQQTNSDGTVRYNNSNSNDDSGSSLCIVPNRSQSSNTPSPFSSFGRRLAQRSTIANLKSNKILPVPVPQSQHFAALDFLSAPEVTRFMQRYNEDLDFENSKILTKDNEIQQYIAEEDDMFTSALGLLSGMEMKGDIPFKTFKTTFSTHLYLQGFYNSRAGDIYVKSRFTVRVNHR